LYSYNTIHYLNLKLTIRFSTLKYNSKLDYCANHYGSTDEETLKHIEYNLKLLHRELESETRIVGKEQFPELDYLTPSDFNPEVNSATRAFLKALLSFYVSKYTSAVKEKGDLLHILNETPEKSNAFRLLRATNENETVASIVKNVTEPHRISEVEGKLIRKLSPIYITPIDYRSFVDFRTQFYTYEKYFLGSYHSTFWFNIGVIWSMSLILFVLLYFNVLKRIVNFRFR